MNTGSGYSVVQMPAPPLTDIPNGPFFENSAISPAALPTACHHGRRRRNDPVDSRARPMPTTRWTFSLITGNNSTTGPPLTSDADYVSLCLSLPPDDPQFQDTRGVRWHYGAPGHSLYNHRRVPNDKQPDCRGGLPHSNRTDPLWNWLSLNITARSYAPRGFNSLHCDGHVQFIKNTISVPVWQSLGSRNGGEVVSADSY